MYLEQISESLTFHLQNLAFLRFERDSSYKDIISPFTRMYLITEGCGSLVIGNKKLALEAGQLPETPDFILLDPPNIVRNKKHLPQALKMLGRMSGSAIKALPGGGYLAVSTCSHHISRGMFMETISGAAANPEINASPGKRRLIISWWSFPCSSWRARDWPAFPPPPSFGAE